LGCGHINALYKFTITYYYLLFYRSTSVDLVCMMIMSGCGECSEEDLGRGAAYARPGYPSSVVDPMRSGISVRDERSRGSSAMMPPSQASYGAGRI